MDFNIIIEEFTKLGFNKDKDKIKEIKDVFNKLDIDVFVISNKTKEG